MNWKLHELILSNFSGIIINVFELHNNCIKFNNNKKIPLYYVCWIKFCASLIRDDCDDNQENMDFTLI